MDELIGLLKQGDNKAVKTLFDQLFHHIRFYCEQITKDEYESEDIAIHSFAKYWERSGHFNTIKEVRSFIYITARNSCFNYLDKLKAQKNYRRTLSAIPSEDVQTMAERYTYEAALLEKLYEEVENLPDQCKEAFKLCYFDRIPRNEVAERLNISINTVHRHCSNAIQKLRLIFGEKELLLLLLLIGLCDN